ncbi:MAG: ATP-grasp domain-containing protein [Patescibacteria group bacterium]|nr:ATP-grasp domain-containing protein [Patescibacteria group bacterium]
MTKTTVFDVLIVYSGRSAISVNLAKVDVLAPFPLGTSYASYNAVYGYFLDICRKNNLRAALTTSADVSGAGSCRSYWLFKKNNWIKVNKTGYSRLIFDKLSPVSKKYRASRELLFSDKLVKPFNQKGMFKIFFDKQKTYNQLAQFSIPTITVEERTKTSIRKACLELKAMISNHPCSDDFSNEIVMKDRFGAGGRDVYKFKAGEAMKMKSVMKQSRKSFILQPLVKFDRVDIRLVYLAGKIVQTYVRTAKAGDFRCNEHQGGLLKYITKAEVPAGVISQAGKLIKFLKKTSSLFSLDFLVSDNGNIYLIEGNTGPGLDWNEEIEENRLAAQKLIRLVIQELAIMI